MPVAAVLELSRQNVNFVLTKVIANTNHLLSTSACNYSIAELECLAILPVAVLPVQPPSLGRRESSRTMLAFFFKGPHRLALLVGFESPGIHLFCVGISRVVCIRMQATSLAVMSTPQASLGTIATLASSFSPTCSTEDRYHNASLEAVIDCLNSRSPGTSQHAYIGDGMLCH